MTIREIQSKTLAILLLVTVFLVIGPQWRASASNNEYKSSYSERITEGEIVKLKLYENEVYVQTEKGRIEVYLNNDAVVKKGGNILKIKDLEKGMKVKITGRELVEIL